MYSHAVSLFDQQLWTSLVQLAPVALASTDATLAGQQGQVVTPRQRAHIHFMLAEALAATHEPKRAEGEYKLALTHSAVKGDQNHEEVALPSDAEIKHKLHLVLIQSGQLTPAINVLQSISSKERSAKIHAALGKLYQRASMERPAVAAYKEVVKVCPLALDCIRAMLQVRVKLASKLSLNSG